MDLYSIVPSKGFFSVVPDREDDYFSVAGRLSRERLAESWRELDFHFLSESSNDREPDMCNIYTSGVVALRAELKAVLFPVQSDLVEFLPINISGVKWFLMNCLKCTSGYDRSRSNLLRSDGIGGVSPDVGEIFMIQSICVTDMSVTDPGVFYIEDSNRAQIVFVGEVRERVLNCGIEGLDFKRIGELYHAPSV